jgi:hypothetical protein
MGKNMGVKLNPEAAYPTAVVNISEFIAARSVRKT